MVAILRPAVKSGALGTGCVACFPWEYSLPIGQHLAVRQL